MKILLDKHYLMFLVLVFASCVSKQRKAVIDVENSFIDIGKEIRFQDSIFELAKSKEEKKEALKYLLDKYTNEYLDSFNRVFLIYRANSFVEFKNQKKEIIVDGSDVSKEIEGKGLEGEYSCQYSERMGDWLISEDIELKITLNKSGVLKYLMKQTIIDEYNGNVPSTKSYSGTIYKTILEKSGVEAWKFEGGVYGRVGAYFFQPSSNENSIRVWIPGNGISTEKLKEFVRK